MKPIQNFQNKCCNSFIQYCLTAGPKPFPKRFLHIVWSRASSFKWEYPLLSFRSSSSFLRLFRLLVTSISPFIFPSITCFRRQFLHKMWPIQLAFCFLISCRKVLQYHYKISHLIYHTLSATNKLFLLSHSNILHLFFYCYTVHFDTLKFLRPMNALIYTHKMLKHTVKISRAAPTCFGPSPHKCNSGKVQR
jgi:hypothetical protein